MNSHPVPDDADLPVRITPRVAATLLGVSSKTLTRWAVGGHLVSTVTPGGHRRYLRDSVLHLRDYGVEVPRAEAS